MFLIGTSLSLLQLRLPVPNFILFYDNQKILFQSIFLNQLFVSTTPQFVKVGQPKYQECCLFFPNSSINSQ